jgi:hypothetical protein
MRNDLTNSPRRIRRLDRAVGAAALFFAIYLALFVGMRDQVGRNRINDSWWHISVADASLHSGQFGPDPFIADAPPFAQFGLTDVMVTALAKVGNVGTADSWGWALALNCALALGGIFAAFGPHANMREELFAYFCGSSLQATSACMVWRSLFLPACPVSRRFYFG